MSGDHAEKRGLNDPRAVNILTTEHWSLLSTRALGYQEMFGRTTIFIAVVSGAVVALALKVQATGIGRETLSVALLLFTVSLFVGLATFVRSVAINLEDARWVAGMSRIRKAYLEIVPELEPYFTTGHEPHDDARALGHGLPQRFSSVALSLTTTSSVVAALNSVLAGAVASAMIALLNGGTTVALTVGATASVVSGVLHARYAARFRRRHAPAA